MIDETVRVLAEECQRLLKLRGEPLCDPANGLVADATVDIKTKAVEVKFWLPTWALLPRPKKKSDERAGSRC